MDELALMQAVASVPAGRWGIGVSGGADSVALLLLMLHRTDIHLHVLHLDHQTRDGESGADAAFVADLATKLNMPCTVQQRTNVEASLTKIPKNTASRFRKARLEFFLQSADDNHLQGILLAHHQDDQIETVAMRLLRGVHEENLTGMQCRSTVGRLQIFRPLLEIPNSALKHFLTQQGQAWREDASNQSDKYQRNRVRFWLNAQPNLGRSLLALASSSENLKRWLEVSAPHLSESFIVSELNQLPLPLAKQSAAEWLARQQVPTALITEAVCNDMLAMASDAASPPRKNFPGGLFVRRRKGIISAER